MGLEAVISCDLTRQSFQDPITHGDSTASETTPPPEGALATATPPGRGYTLGIQGKPPGLSTAQEKGLDTTGVHPWPRGSKTCARAKSVLRGGLMVQIDKTIRFQGEE